jgi:3-mercaptopyruvate sulfurtransferase SseA
VARADALPALLGPAGVDATHEAVIVSDGGLNPDSALAFLLLARAGQRKVSILADSVDDWGFAGFPLTKDETVVAARKTPGDLAIPPTHYPARGRDGVILTRADDAKGAYPTLFVASGTSVPANVPAGKVVHVPYTDLVERNGAPKAAKDIWKRLSDAGVPRYAQIVVFAEDPGEAAVNYVVLKLMGFPDVKVLLV